MSIFPLKNQFMIRVKRFASRMPFLPFLLNLLEFVAGRAGSEEERAALTGLQAGAPALFAPASPPAGMGTVVVFGQGKVDFVILESFLLKCFAMASYRILVLSGVSPVVRRAYEACRVDRIEYLSRYCIAPPLGSAQRLLDGVTDFPQLVNMSLEGIRVGKYTASTVMRKTRMGHLPLDDSEVRNEVLRQLETSIAYARGAQKLIDDVAPQAALFVDRGYSSAGEFFDAFTQHGIPCYTWNAAHRDNALLLKRYSLKNRDTHPSSLSEKSWALIRDMPWDEEKLEEIHRELFHCYSSGQWYGEVGTQFNKKLVDPHSLGSLLGLDPGKKTAVIYSHIFWDATFFWGEDLFRDYEDWFVKTIRTAIENDRLNWLVKVHPANATKDKRDGFRGETSEMRVIRQVFGRLPGHVKVIPADSEISTYSLMKLMDYCLTVRGTVGIEGALLGKTILTAGTGRYDRLGFTVDFDTPEAYLECLGHLEEVPPPTEEMKDLAARFAYGVFLCRPVPLHSMTMEYLQDEKATLRVGWKTRESSDLQDASDITAVARWIESGDEDFLQL